MGTNLTDAQLLGAHLKGAFLEGAMLAGARLVDADLTDADLTFAFFEAADFTRVRWARTAQVPEAGNETPIPVSWWGRVLTFGEQRATSCRFSSRGLEET